jgi:hypothetical protein
MHDEISNEKKCIAVGESLVRISEHLTAMSIAVQATDPSRAMMSPQPGGRFLDVETLAHRVAKATKESSRELAEELHRPSAAEHFATPPLSTFTVDVLSTFRQSMFVVMQVVAFVETLREPPPPAVKRPATRSGTRLERTSKRARRSSVSSGPSSAPLRPPAAPEAPGSLAGAQPSASRIVRQPRPSRPSQRLAAALRRVPPGTPTPPGSYTGRRGTLFRPRPKTSRPRESSRGASGWGSAPRA